MSDDLAARAETEDAEIVELFKTLGYAVAPEDIAELKRILAFDNVRELRERMKSAEASRALRERAAPRQLVSFIAPSKTKPRTKSESDRLRAERWTREQMIRALKAHGYPGRREYQRLHKRDPEGMPGDYSVWREFGSWAKALEEARRSRLTI